MLMAVLVTNERVLSLYEQIGPEQLSTLHCWGTIIRLYSLKVKSHSWSHFYLTSGVVEVLLERVDLLGEVLLVLQRGLGLDDLPAHLDHVLDLGLDVGQRVDDAGGVVQLTLDALLLGRSQLCEVELERE